MNHSHLHLTQSLVQLILSVLYSEQIWGKCLKKENRLHLSERENFWNNLFIVMY